MHLFKDREGTEWTIDLNLGAVKRVKDLIGCDLLCPEQPWKDGATERPLLTCLEADIILLCDVIYALCKPKADERAISDEQFGARLGGDAILAAHDALFGELKDFFLKLGRGHHAKMIDKQTALVSAGIKAAETKLDDVDIDTLVEESMTLAGGTSGRGGMTSIGLPGSSVSTPTASP